MRENDFPMSLVSTLVDQTRRRNSCNIAGNLTNTKIHKSLTYRPGLSERLERSGMLNRRGYKIAHRSCNTLYKLFTNVKDRIIKLDL